MAERVIIETDVPEPFKPALNKIQEKAENLSRMTERGIVNEQSGASVVARDSGQVNLSANEYTQYKLNPDGKAVEQSIESVTITNRKSINADELVINNHKLNPHLYELTDYKYVQHGQSSIVGNFCMLGTVLTKCWEPNLNRYVLIRRLARIPMFSPQLNVPEIPGALKIADPLNQVQELQVTMSTGNITDGDKTLAQQEADEAKSAANKETLDKIKAATQQAAE